MGLGCSRGLGRLGFFCIVGFKGLGVNGYSFWVWGFAVY